MSIWRDTFPILYPAVVGTARATDAGKQRRAYRRNASSTYTDDPTDGLARLLGETIVRSVHRSVASFRAYRYVRTSGRYIASKRVRRACGSFGRPASVHRAVVGHSTHTYVWIVCCGMRNISPTVRSFIAHAKQVLDLLPCGLTRKTRPDKLGHVEACRRFLDMLSPREGVMGTLSEKHVLF